MIPLKLFSISIPQDVWSKRPHERPLADLAIDAEGSARRIRKGSNARREKIRFAQLSSYIETEALELLRQSRENGKQNSGGVNLKGIASLVHTEPVSAVCEYVDIMERFQIALRNGELGDGTSSPWPKITPISGFWHFVQTFFTNVHPAWKALFPNEQAKVAFRRIWLSWKSFRESRRTPTGVESNQQCSLLIGATCHTPDTVSSKLRLFERLTVLNIRGMAMFQGVSEETLHRVSSLLGEKASFYRAAHAKKAAVIEVLVAA